MDEESERTRKDREERQWEEWKKQKEEENGPRKTSSDKKNIAQGKNESKNSRRRKRKATGGEDLKAADVRE